MAENFSTHTSESQEKWSPSTQSTQKNPSRSNVKELWREKSRWQVGQTGVYY